MLFSKKVNVHYIIVFLFLFYSACGGDLQSILDADIIPFEHDAARFIRQLVEALVFLHDKNIVHLDIKVRI